MKTLLYSVICYTRDEEVFKAITPAEGWPSFYTVWEAIEDVQCLEGRVEHHLETDAYDNISMLMLHKHNIEIAKEMMRLACEATAMKHFIKTFLTRPLTIEETQEILNDPSVGYPIEVERSIETLNELFHQINHE